MSDDLPAPPGVAELLVSRVAPHMVLAASPAFLRSANYAEADVVGRSATILVGEGSCLSLTHKSLSDDIQLDC